MRDLLRLVTAFRCLIIRKIKNSSHFPAVREDIGTRMNLDANYVFICPGAKVSVAKIAHGVRQQRGQDLLCILCDLRVQVADPTHLLAGGIEKRIPSGHLLDH
ncbi:MAG: hypothetical protein JWN45_764 [Acidobacteriaceae bacterium]|nr:hypothetical protein [Acidobacteriaceae bacterium]